MTNWKRIIVLGAILSSAVVAQVPAPESPPTAPADPLAKKYLLRQILIAESLEAAQALTPAPDRGFVVLAPALSKLDAVELAKRLAAGENQVIETRILASIAQVIENFVRQHDFPVATAIIPPQNISDGVLRVAVLLGKVRKIQVQGNRWFSEALLREKLRVEQGETLRLSELDSAISWVNNNPFRRVRVHLEPVPGTGEADMIIGVQEALPLRLSLSCDDGGNEVLGTNRYVAGLSYANLWGLDHQVSYQYITSDRPRIFQAHGFDYRVPLPWRHYVQLSASYLRARPEFYDGLFVQDGKNITTDLRYTIPLRTGDTPAEIYATLSFKESNNNLAYGGTEVLATKNDIFQVTAGGSTVRRDKRGAWAFGASITASPGGVNSRNTDAIFNEAHFGAKAAYVYGTLFYQRLLTLTRGWEFTSRGILHLSGQNLLSSEQLTIGGSGSVRGFNENVFSGDQGFVFTNDLLTPAWKKTLSFVPKNRGPLETRFVLFYDAANTQSKHQYTGSLKNAPLASTGVGVRISLAPNFSLSADYGWQITHLPYATTENSRGHIKVSLAF